MVSPDAGRSAFSTFSWASVKNIRVYPKTATFITFTVVAVVLAAAAGAALAWATHPRTQRVAVTVAPTAACPGVRVEVGQ